MMDITLNNFAISDQGKPMALDLVYVNEVLTSMFQKCDGKLRLTRRVATLAIHGTGMQDGTRRLSNAGWSWVKGLEPFISPEYEPGGFTS
jgi:hypothetical protein